HCLHGLQRRFEPRRHRIKAARRRERESIFRRARGLEHGGSVLARLANVSQELLLLAVEPDLALDIRERPRGDSGARRGAKVPNRGVAGTGSRTRTGRRTRVWCRISILRGRSGLAPEYAVEEVVVDIGPIAVVVARGPERVVKDVGV